MATETVSLGEMVVLLWRIKERSSISLNHLDNSADCDPSQLNRSRDKGLTLMEGSAHPARRTYGCGCTLCVGFIDPSFRCLKVRCWIDPRLPLPLLETRSDLQRGICSVDL